MQLFKQIFNIQSIPGFHSQFQRLLKTFSSSQYTWYYCKNSGFFQFHIAFQLVTFHTRKMPSLNFDIFQSKKFYKAYLFSEEFKDTFFYACLKCFYHIYKIFWYK